MHAAQQTNQPLMKATTIGTVLQLAMVVSGHYAPAIAQQFAVAGMGISAVAGYLFTRFAPPGALGKSAGGGAVSGGLCALIGILVSHFLGDVPATVIGFGTAGSAATGAIGGLIGNQLDPRRK